MKRTQSEETDSVQRLIAATHSIIGAFAVAPFLTMFVWNTLVQGMFGVATVGYVGALAINLLRAYFFRPVVVTEERTAEESLQRAIAGYVFATLTAICTLIFGLLLGYL